jgi:hypothetical protein
MDNDLVNSVERPFISMSIRPVSEFEDSINRLRIASDTRFVCVLRGRRMRTISTLLTEIAAAMQFPHYFGENWNALYECMRDLSWLPATSYVLAITDCEDVLVCGSVEDRRAFGALLRDTCEYWSAPDEPSEAWGHAARPFHVFLQGRTEDSMAGFGDVFS